MDRGGSRKEGDSMEEWRKKGGCGKKRGSREQGKNLGKENKGWKDGAVRKEV